MGSFFGTVFRVATWGESHGGGIGVVIDGCPPRLPLSEEDIQIELDRRRPGQSSFVTQRKESDRAEILSGVFQGYTLGTPIAILVRNTDARPEAYEEMREKFRPSHADFTYQAKYGIRNWEGGGRSSARETIGRVAAGAVASKLLRKLYPDIQIVAFVSSIHDIDASIDPLVVTREMVEANPIRCPDPSAAEKMAERIRQARTEGDSVGGVICCVVKGVPPGLGDPVFDRLEADLAKAMLSLPATKGFQIGSGFAGTRLRGSEHNDPFVPGPAGTIVTTTNHSGGVQGGISNGQPIIFWTAFKPTATIAKTQQTVDVKGNPTDLAARGRHDPCVLPRAVPIVEAMT
ncbi:MAG: chorismate synthase, partial [Chthoniobacterales bacterium]|nr:chorismate synthase [Chthoniobacterales bacterium]